MVSLHHMVPDAYSVDKFAELTFVLSFENENCCYFILSSRNSSNKWLSDSFFVKFPLGFEVNVNVNCVYVHNNCHRIIDGNRTIKMTFFRQLLLNQPKRKVYQYKHNEWDEIEYTEWDIIAASQHVIHVNITPCLVYDWPFLSEWCNIALLFSEFFMTVQKMTSFQFV